MSVSAQTRARAARVVAAVAVRGRSLDAALAGELEGSRQERGLLRSLSYDSIRWFIRLEALLERLLARPGQELAPEIRALAIVGLCQLLYTDIPAHAAVAETVNAARLLGHARAAGLINALLRRAQREYVEYGAVLDRDLAVRTAHPRWFVDALQSEWGERRCAILAANNERPPFWVRVNRRRMSGAAYRARLQAQGVEVLASHYDDEALLLAQALDVQELPGFAAGEASVQDAAAQLAARLVAPQAGERVLDACAAPGGKTGHLLELAPEIGELLAIDASGERLRRVAENLERLNLCASVLTADASEPEEWFDGRLFDKILVDAPCSGTGVIRRHPDIKLLRRAADIPALAARQSKLLSALWPLLAPGGRLVYASCSALRAESADVISGFIAAHPHARDVTAAAVAASGQGSMLAPWVSDCGLRIAAGTSGMDGFYYACLERTAGAP
jgi:16S rRNA (cytosine967-C5)-methyltransferase